MKRKAIESRTRKAARIAHRIVRFSVAVDPYESYYAYMDSPEYFFENVLDCVLSDSETAKADTADWLDSIDESDNLYKLATSILEELEELETMTA